MYIYLTQRPSLYSPIVNYGVGNGDNKEKKRILKQSCIDQLYTSISKTEAPDFPNMIININLSVEIRSQLSSPTMFCSLESNEQNIVGLLSH